MILLLALVLSAGEFRIPRCDGACQRRGDTVEVVLPVGGQAELEWPGPVSSRGAAPFRPTSADRLRWRPDSTGSGLFRVQSRPDGPGWVRWTALPVLDLTVRARSAGSAPGPISWDRTLVEAELRRLLGPAGLRVGLQEDSSLRIPSSNWDLDGNGRLDLWRDESPDQASPEEAALHAALRRKDMAFPSLVLFQDPLRLEWPLQGPVRSGDSLLRLSSSRALAWRDASGRTERYALEGPRGERNDPFVVADYPVAGIRVRAQGPRGGWKHDHPASDVVVRLGTGFPAFGTTDRRDPAPVPLIFLEPGADGDPIRCARVLAHELGHALGLPDEARPTNLMSALMRMEVESPVLLPGQVQRLRSRLEAIRAGR